ncbi:MAG: FG-GAP-like repeat-containing protein, partial [Myxococcota bacterium]|nr:FG-GAP-like repeat-containing protein [Myxococcota bacterium]
MTRLCLVLAPLLLSACLPEISEPKDTENEPAETGAPETGGPSDNTAPQVDSITLSPDEVYTDDVLTAEVETSDVDGDAVNVSYAWYVDEELVLEGAGEDTLDGGTYFERDQLVYVVATPDDELDGGEAGTSETVTILNSPPGVESASIEPAEPTSLDELTCSGSGYADADGDTDSSTFGWSVEGAGVGTGPTLSGAFLPAETVTCTLTPGDGTDEGEPVSASVTIVNTAPQVTGIGLSPDEVHTDETITASVTTDDVDGDAVSVSYAWYVDESLVLEGTGEDVLDGAAWFDKGQSVYVIATPGDDTDEGESATSESLVISNSAPEAPGVTIHELERVYSRVETGHRHSCALTVEGTVDCWGEDAHGQVNAPSGTYVEVSAGAEGGCAVDGAGSLTCWGYDGWGEVSEVPTGVFEDVASGANHSCAIDTTGAIECWGSDFYGESSSYPTTGTFEQVSSGTFHSCAVDTSGTVECWGSDDYGQATPSVGVFSQVSAGHYHSCGIDSASEVQCWGLDDSGESSPPSGTFSQVSAGYGYSCGVDTSGAIQCWGDDRYGESSDIPTGTFTQVDAGGYTSFSHTCATDTDGAVHCWGDDSKYQQLLPWDLVCMVETDAYDADEDELTYTFDWDVDGTAYTGATDVYETGDTVPHGDFGDGETWTCTVTPADIDGDGTAGTGSVTFDEVSCTDLNCDGYPDIIFANHTDGDDYDISAYVYWGSSSGFSSLDLTGLAAQGAYDLDIHDLDVDGYLDVILVNHTIDGVDYAPESYIYWGSSSGYSLSNRTELPAVGAGGCTVHDLDADGYPDIILANSHDTTGYSIDSYIYWGSSHGYTESDRTGLPTKGANRSAVEDLDGNGYPDIVFANYYDDHTASFDTSSYIYWGSSSGYSDSDRSDLPTLGASGAAIHDLDADGYPDIVFANLQDGSSGNIDSYIYWGTATGYSELDRTDLETQAGRDVEIGDLDLDGYPDIVFANANNGVVGAVDSYIYWGSASAAGRGYSETNRSGLPTQ